MAGKSPNYEKQIFREVHETPSEYWPNLLMLIRLFRESVALKPASTCFIKAWQEAMADDTRPISELWEGIDAE